VPCRARARLEKSEEPVTAAAAAALARYLLFGTLYPPLGAKGFWAYSALLSVLVGAKLVTPFYVKPAAAIAYAVPAWACSRPLLSRGANSICHISSRYKNDEYLSFNRPT
jgi:hypothetical protein